MSSRTIPYDPSLVLGNIINDKALQQVEAISEAEGPANAAQDDVNALLLTRRSFDMLRSELLGLGMDPEKDLKTLDEKITKISADIAEAAKSYAEAAMTASEKVRSVRKDMQMVHDQVESPIDYTKTALKSMPLSADSMTMDVQYFSKDVNQQDASLLANSVSGFVSASMSHMGNKVSAMMSGAAAKQVSEQASRHSLEGTLVVSVSCTHKNATVLAPLFVNVDKGIKAFNKIFPGEKLDPTNVKQMDEIAKKGEEGNDKKFSILSGVTFGSSFVGMVHVLNTTSTKASEKLTTAVASLQAQMETGAWLEKASGGFGVNTQMSNDVKKLLSTQSIDSHVTLVSMGVIPSVVANDVRIGVDTFAKFDPQSGMAQLAAIQNSAAGSQNSLTASATAARTGKEMIEMKTSDMKAGLQALATIEDGKNKIIDINSMMTALDDYLKKAAAGTCGVPINYYLTDISKLMLAEMWVAKYLPGEYVVPQNDDSGLGGAAAPPK